MAGIEKYSFHKTGICRSSFIKEHCTPATMNDRAMFKWRRAQTLAAGDAARVTWIAFPTDYLSRPTLQEEEQSKDKVLWLAAAPAAGATYVELAYTTDSETRVREAFDARQERSLVSFLMLPTGEALLVDYYHADWVNKELRMPGDGRVPDLLFSPDDPHDTGRPIRIRFGPAPANGDAVVIQELGGFAVAFQTKQAQPVGAADPPRAGR